MSEWADQKRVLSPEASSEYGRWRTDRAPYLREIMDCGSDPSVNEVTCVLASQMGKTEVLLNILGYNIECDPGPMIVCQPNAETMARAFSTDRLSPMLRDSPSLRDKVSAPKSRDSGNTIYHKQFIGGHVTMIGANAVSGFAMRPIKITLADEVNRYPVTEEGSGLALLERRTANFWGAQNWRFSSPTSTDFSLINDLYDAGDCRQYWVACVHCNEYQILNFWQLRYQEGNDGNNAVDARYECEHCKREMDERDKMPMLRSGQWVARLPFKGHASFHLSAMYSPWQTWQKIASEYVQASKPGQIESLRTWYNTALAETFDGSKATEAHKWTGLMARREHYDLVPNEVVEVTAAVDVQHDRVEAEVCGWGANEECWSLELYRLYGDPSRPDVWGNLAETLRRPLRGEDGQVWTPTMVCIDSGYMTSEVYAWCRDVGPMWAIPIKGSSRHDAPIVDFPRKPNAHGVYLTQVGGQNGKDVIAARMEITDSGPGCYHWPAKEAYDEAYFKQLTAERREMRRAGGQAYRMWTAFAANEAKDLQVYNLAAIRILQRFFGIALDQLPIATNRPTRDDSPVDDPDEGRVNRFRGREGPYIRRPTRRGAYVRRY